MGFCTHVTLPSVHDSCTAFFALAEIGRVRRSHDWDVRATATTTQLVGGMLALRELLAGAAVDEDPDRDHLGCDPSAAYDARADHDAWKQARRPSTEP